MEFSFDRFYQVNRKAIIWVVLFGLIYLLRDYFTLIFLTFIISFFAFPASKYLRDRLRLSQSIAVVLVYVMIAGGHIALYVFVLPKVVQQMNAFRNRLPEIESKWDELWVDYTERYSGIAILFNFDVESPLLNVEDISNRNWQKVLERLNQSNEPYPWIRQLLPDKMRQQLVTHAPTIHADQHTDSEPDATNDSVISLYDDLEWRDSLIEAINQKIIENRKFFLAEKFAGPLEKLQEDETIAEPEMPATHNKAMLQLLDEYERNAQLSRREIQKLNRFLLEVSFEPHIPVQEYRAEKEISQRLDQGRTNLLKIIPEVALKIIKFFLTSLLAILFSFLIVFDYARLTKEVHGLASSRLRDFFVEAGQPVVKFARSVGQGFQAIALIAFITTLMVVAALIMLRISSLALLAVIAFVTSLIPVVGVVFEAIPVFLVALNEQSAERAIWAMVALLIIHVIIGYVITPIIFGRRFKINLVAMVFILYIGNQIAGVWGMILGVPIANYLLRDVLGVPSGEDKPLAEEAATASLKSISAAVPEKAPLRDPEA